MQTPGATTPFGRRQMTIGIISSQLAANDRSKAGIVHKWHVFQHIKEARQALGATDRALTILHALLSFHPETALEPDGELIVWPSNEKLMARANGMPPTTLRRNIANLVDCGLIIRKDSPNGKRYARKGQGGEIEQVFGFDLAPMVARAEEYKSLAQAVQAEKNAFRVVKERLTLLRRDIVKMIEAGVSEGVPGDWRRFQRDYQEIAGQIPRTAPRQLLERIAGDMEKLWREIRQLLETFAKTPNPDANESHSGRHIQNSNPDISLDLEPDFQEGRTARTDLKPQTSRFTEGAYPLGMVLTACPDIVDYAKGGISSWRDFLATAAVVRSMLGISPSAWDGAQTVLGEKQAAVVVACILQRGTAIRSAGGYLRSLTRKAEVGEFSLGPILMSQINSRRHDKRRA